MLTTGCHSGRIESTGGCLNVFYANVFADRSRVTVVAFRQHLGALKSFNCINGHDRGLFFYLSGPSERKGGTILSLKPSSGSKAVDFWHRFSSVFRFWNTAVHRNFARRLIAAPFDDRIYCRGNRPFAAGLNSLWPVFDRPTAFGPQVLRRRSQRRAPNARDVFSGVNSRSPGALESRRKSIISLCSEWSS